MACKTCPHFKHNEKHTYKEMFSYGCNASMNGLTFWTNNEEYFSRFGCEMMGEEGEMEQMDIFEFIGGE